MRMWDKVIPIPERIAVLTDQRVMIGDLRVDDAVQSFALRLQMRHMQRERQWRRTQVAGWLIVIALLWWRS